MDIIPEGAAQLLCARGLSLLLQRAAGCHGRGQPGGPARGPCCFLHAQQQVSGCRWRVFTITHHIFPGVLCWVKQGSQEASVPGQGGTKPDTDPPRPSGQNLADAGMSLFSAFGGRVREGVLEEASMGMRWREREEHSKLKEKHVQRP